MTQLNQIYKCHVCGNVVEVVHTGAGELVCCGQSMELQKENTVDAVSEKHVPVVKFLSEDKEKRTFGVQVKIGETPHPMDKEHYIEWIEIKMVESGRIAKKYLKPGDAPEVEFHSRGKEIEIRAYCNIHGLWQSK